MAILKRSIGETDKVIWVHVASLGEFEQGLPVIEKLKVAYPSHKILLTFFSPSGFEVKKNTDAADVVVYLPLDSRKKTKAFLDAAHPELAIFVKYEIWPNYIRELQQQKIPAILISAIFNKKQIYFKGYGGFMRRALGGFSHYFVQNEASKVLLSTLNIQNTTVCGDTRFDRVSEILEQDNQLDFMDTFKQDSKCFVAGSTWPADEEVLLDHINNASDGIKFVIAPHKIQFEKVLAIKAALLKKTALYSERNKLDLGDYEVLLIDHIGLLTKIYSYADFAYVGGGFATGLHNTLEPAVFGVPVVIGPKYDGFQEAEELVKQKGVLSITDQFSFNETMNRLYTNTDFANETGAINARYITENRGASIQIIAHVRTLI